MRAGTRVNILRPKYLYYAFKSDLPTHVCCHVGAEEKTLSTSLNRSQCLQLEGEIIAVALLQATLPCRAGSAPHTPRLNVFVFLDIIQLALMARLDVPQIHEVSPGWLGCTHEIFLALKARVEVAHVEINFSVEKGAVKQCLDARGQGTDEEGCFLDQLREDETYHEKRVEVRTAKRNDGILADGIILRVDRRGCNLELPSGVVGI